VALTQGTTAIGSQDSGTSHTISITAASGCTLFRVAVVVPSGIAVTCSSSVNGSFGTEYARATNGASIDIVIFKLVSPTAGAHTLTVTTDSSTVAASRCTQFTGGDTTTPLGTAYTTTGNGTAISGTAIDSANGDIVLDDWGYNVGGQSPTPGTGQTEDTFSSNGNFDIRLRGSHEAATGSSTVMSWTTTSTLQWAQVTTTVKAAAAAPTFPTEFFKIEKVLIVKKK